MVWPSSFVLSTLYLCVGAQILQLQPTRKLPSSRFISSSDAWKYFEDWAKMKECSIEHVKFYSISFINWTWSEYFLMHIATASKHAYIYIYIYQLNCFRIPISSNLSDPTHATCTLAPILAHQNRHKRAHHYEIPDEQTNEPPLNQNILPFRLLSVCSTYNGSGAKNRATSLRCNYIARQF